MRGLAGHKSRGDVEKSPFYAAARLGVSESTVHTHLHNIYLKLEVNGKTEAIKKAQRLKIF